GVLAARQSEVSMEIRRHFCFGDVLPGASAGATAQLVDPGLNAGIRELAALDNKASIELQLVHDVAFPWRGEEGRFQMQAARHGSLRRIHNKPHDVVEPPLFYGDVELA